MMIRFTHSVVIIIGQNHPATEYSVRHGVCASIVIFLLVVVVVVLGFMINISRNMKHELCTFWLRQNLHKCFIFCSNPRRKLIVRAIYYTYIQ